MKRCLILLSLLFCNSAFAQTETTKWYINGQLYATTSCESGGDINTPNVPEQFGYTFEGWEPAIYDMSTLDPSINGTSYTEDFNAKKYFVQFSYGKVYGTSLCSSTPNDQYILNDTGLNTTADSGRYCWCRLTEFIPTGSDRIYEPILSNWVFNKDYGSVSECSRSACTQYCRHFLQNGELRRKLYGIN